MQPSIATSSKRATTAPTGSRSQLQYLKSGHTLSLDYHYNGSINRMHPRDKFVTCNKAPTYPALPYDVSEELVKETCMRKNLHRAALDTDPNVFKKKAEPESTSDFFYQKHMIKDYLLEMHMYHDPRDIAHRPYTTSRLKRNHENHQQQQQHFHASQRVSIDNFSNYSSNNNEGKLEVLQDFLQPDDAVRPRTSGYNRGHIRSILGLDVYGEQSSKDKNDARATGILPLSPTADRYEHITPTSPNLQINRTIANCETFSNSNRSKSSTYQRIKLKEKSNKIITYDDKLLRDPVTKSIHWFKSHNAKVEEKKKLLLLKRKYQEKQYKQQIEAENVIKELQLFESLNNINLKSSHKK